MIDLKEALLSGAEACDATGIQLNPSERAAFIMGYLIGGPLESDREVFIKVYNQTPEVAAAELASLSEFDKAKFNKLVSITGLDINDMSNWLDSVKPKLRIVE